MKLKISRAGLAKAAAAARPHVLDASGAAGLGLVVHGIGMIYAPAAWITGGLALLAYALVVGRPARKAT